MLLSSQYKNIFKKKKLSIQNKVNLDFKSITDLVISKYSSIKYPICQVVNKLCRVIIGLRSFSCWVWNRGFGSLSGRVSLIIGYLSVGYQVLVMQHRVKSRLLVFSGRVQVDLQVTCFTKISGHGRLRVRSVQARSSGRVSF